MKLTEKERRFVEAFLGKCAGNASAAAREAGYSGRSAHVLASRLLRKVKIQQLLAQRITKRETVSDLTNEQIDKRLMEIAQDASCETRDQLSAIGLLCRVRGRFSVSVNVKGKLTLEEALTRVHAKVKEREQQGLTGATGDLPLEVEKRRLKQLKDKGK